MLKFFRIPFALSGNRTPIPDAADANGFVSYIEGYGPDYQRAKTDVLSKNIERDKMNELFFDITNAIAEIQAQGVPDWITSALNGGSPFSYAKNALVRYTDGNVYMSLVAANTAAPTDLTKWAPLTASALLDRLSLINPFKAVGDGVTSDQTPVANAIAALRDRILTNEGYKFLVTSVSNPRGVDLGSAFGHVVKNITGGQQKLNSPGDRDKYVFGMEYMAAFHKLLIAQVATPTRKPIMVFSGDSTTYGMGGNGVDPDYTISELMKGIGETRGLQTPYGLNSINRGQPGANTQQWVDTHLAGDLAANPDVLVLRWGINDPGWLQNGTTPPLDSGQNFPNRRTPADFIASLRTGLTTIRAARGVASLSIVLMSMNPTSDTPNARDELWQEQVLPGIRQAARDFQCCFVDTFSYLRDARPAAGVWMDNPFSDGRAIHPLNVMNTWISTILGEVLFPYGLASKVGRSVIRNQGGAEYIGNAADAPASYPFGVKISRAATGSGFPLDGVIVTVRAVDQVVVQTNYSFRDDSTQSTVEYYTRVGRAVDLGPGAPVGWSPWISTNQIAAVPAPGAGFAAVSGEPAAVQREGTLVCLSGPIAKSAPAAVPSGTVFATIPPRFRPNISFYFNAVIWDGSAAFASLPCRVNSNGNIETLAASGISVNRIFLNCCYVDLN